VASTGSSPASARSLANFARKLAASIEGDVRFDAGMRAVYSTDASNYRQLPIGVVAPRHEGDVAMALALARENALPILARGGGTSLAGQACNAALVLDFSKYMNRIVAIDAARRIATVEPGVVQSQLNAALAPHGLFFAPDPSTKDRCTLGGMIGNNSCGAHSAAYGKTVDNLEALDAILYEGTRLELGGQELPDRGRAAALVAELRAIADRYGDSVRANFPKIPRRVSGYNLDELLPEHGFSLARALVGSEGSLAIVTQATVKLVPRPKRRALACLGFDDVFIAADQTPWLLEHGPEALEGFDHHLPEFGRARGLDAIRLLPDGQAFLIAEVGGDTGGDVRDRAERIVAEARRHRACAGARCLTDPREQASLWGLRESGLGAGAFIPGRARRTWPGAEDTAVPPAKLGPYLRRLEELLSRRGLEAATWYGHFGEGCVHGRINFDLASADGIATFRATMEEIAALVAEFGGSLSGEHGDGVARSELLPAMYPPDLIEAFREFKRVFDPDRRMNPGVIVNPYPLDSHLKLGADWRPRAPATHFDFSAEGGLAGAALKCVGIGKCRKTDAGTMCPSYMATRDEMHSTRGRARLLFEALSGDALAGGFGDPALKEALDLCLSCKGCKKECPSAVDMAAYRAEFLAQYYEDNRRPLSARFFGRLPELARLASGAPQLANAITSAPGISALGRRALGIHPARSLPRLAAQSFRAWFAQRAIPNAGAPEVVLFPDTFTNYFEPAIAIAAVEVLERAGFRVTLPARELCCGRPLYDQGMLDLARMRLEDAMAVLGPTAERGISIVGLEPSCILTFRDELAMMFPRDARARALVRHAALLDEFLAREAPSFSAPALEAPALLHGHCHQQALAGLDHEIALLSRVAGLGLKVLDAGCCGMAGAFGYAREHFDLSRAIANRALVPAIEASAPETIVVADGFSCRAQIRQFCPDRRVMHLAEVLNAPAPAGA
jgi:FAD/FMN-containing dehydrogenase/Fe-S oxidoreductase